MFREWADGGQQDDFRFPLFDDFVSEQKQPWADGKPQLFCRFHIDEEFKLGRLLDGQVRWFGAFYKLIHMKHSIA